MTVLETRRLCDRKLALSLCLCLPVLSTSRQRGGSCMWTQSRYQHSGKLDTKPGHAEPWGVSEPRPPDTGAQCDQVSTGMATPRGGTQHLPLVTHSSAHRYPTFRRPFRPGKPGPHPAPVCTPSGLPGAGPLPAGPRAAAHAVGSGHTPLFSPSLRGVGSPPRGPGAGPGQRRRQRSVLWPGWWDVSCFRLPWQRSGPVCRGCSSGWCPYRP